MELIKATETDFPTIRAFYDNVIDNTAGMAVHAQWKHGSHPFDDTILGFIRSGDMYLCMENEQLVSVLAVPFHQDEDYHAISWSVPAEDDEVATLHIFAVAPEFQGKGYGKRVISLAVELAKAHGMKVFRIDALSSNVPAHKLYLAAGFQMRGTQRLYTDNAGWIDFYYYEFAYQF